MRLTLNGPQEIGNSSLFWGGFAAVVLGLALLPLAAGDYTVSNTAYFFIFVFLALSLGLIWGYTGIFSFGQTAFFGVGGYVYGILTINLAQVGYTFGSLAAAVAVAGLFALVVGYFMFYGGVSDVYIGIITLATTLVLETFLAQTAGYQWAVGTALLGGFNGMTGIEPLRVGEVYVEGAVLYYGLLGLLVLTYLALRLLVNSDYGYAMVGIRENRVRTETLGYDIRRIQLQVFTLAGILAGFSGAVYAAWGQYITPSSMGLTNAALPVIWVAVGGRKSLASAAVSAIVIMAVSQQFSLSGSQYALVALGALLLVVIMFAPEGFGPAVARAVDRARDRWKGRA